MALEPRQKRFTRRSVSSPWSVALTSSSIVARAFFLPSSVSTQADRHALTQRNTPASDERFHALPLKMRLRARMPRPLNVQPGPFLLSAG